MPPPPLWGSAPRRLLRPGLLSGLLVCVCVGGVCLVLGGWMCVGVVGCFPAVPLRVALDWGARAFGGLQRGSLTA